MQSIYLKKPVMNTHRNRLIQLGLLPSTYRQKSRWNVVKRLEDEFRIRGPLGSGSFSYVLLADMLSRNDLQVVLKIYKKQDLTEASEVDTLVALDRITGGLGQRNINSILEWLVWKPVEQSDVPDILVENGYEKGKEYIVYCLEFVRGQEMLKAIKSYWQSVAVAVAPTFSRNTDEILAIYREKTPPEPPVVRKLLFGLLSALSFLHALGFTHRDIKPENIRIRESTQELILLDFGFACNIEYENAPAELLSCQNRRVAGTPFFMAPELFPTGVRTSTEQRMAADVWATGLVFAFLVNGYRPFPTTRSLSALQTNLNLYQEPPLIIYSKDKTINLLLQKMLEKDWQKRIYAIVALEKLRNNEQSEEPFTEQEIDAAMLDPRQKSNVVPYYVKQGERSVLQTIVDDADEDRVDSLGALEEQIRNEDAEAEDQDAKKRKRE